MRELVLPLFYRPIPKRGRKKSPDAPYGVTLKGGDDATLLTRDNFETLLDDIGDRGLPRFHLFDTIGEARAVRKFFMTEEARLKGSVSATEIGSLRDGEGILMILHRDRPVTDNAFELIDNRLAKERSIIGSWDVVTADCATALDAPAGANRHDLALAIAAKMAALPAELVRDVQIALERVPGAYTGFVSVSPEDVRRDYRFEDVDPARLPDALIQPFIGRASSKVELGDALNEAMDATVERLLEAHPDLVSDGSDGPEP